MKSEKEDLSNVIKLIAGVPGVIFHLTNRKLKNDSCEYDRLNG